MNCPQTWFPNSWPLVVEEMVHECVGPKELDALLAEGWRYFGPQFFRASVVEEVAALKRQVALRVAVADFARSKSQRRVWKSNQDLEVELAPARPGKEEEELFLKHRERFDRNVPENLAVFLGGRPDGVPSACLQVSVRQEGKLVAASYLARGEEACSSIYGIFDPDLSSRSLGIFTMLLELHYAQRVGLRYYYSGYATLEPGCYDYKKSFSALSYYRWDGDWRGFERAIL
jgi:arginyl-tRNA--protein-N-Asp/Glu arginylyltransferase